MTMTPSSPATIRPITQGPDFHWFGYYDKLQFDPTGRYALGMATDFEHRSPCPTAHLIWCDDEQILAWSRRAVHGDAFYLFRDTEDTMDDDPDHIQVVGKAQMRLNGHCTYLPNREWILNNTYPQGTERLQALYLYHVPTDRRVELGAFHAPSAYTGPLRSDLHPRSSPDGSKLVIDSAHAGNGRQMYLIDIGSIQ